MVVSEKSLAGGGVEVKKRSEKKQNILRANTLVKICYNQFMVENQNTTDASEIKLDRKSKILFIALAILIIGSVAATYWRYMVKRDYIIESQIDCDPETENCFVWECDPMSLEEGEACTGVPDNDIWYYKIFSRNAMNVPDCPASPAGGDPADENCPAYVCAEGEADCGEELCAPENVPDGEQCNDPEQYLGRKSARGGVRECEEGDEECLAEEESPENNEEPAETEEQGDLNEDNPGEINSGDQYIPPLGAESN